MTELGRTISDRICASSVMTESASANSRKFELSSPLRFLKGSIATVFLSVPVDVAVMFNSGMKDGGFEADGYDPDEELSGVDLPVNQFLIRLNVPLSTCDGRNVSPAINGAPAISCKTLRRSSRI